MEKLNMFERTLMAGIGFYAMTKEKAQAMVDDLVKRGELSKEEGAEFAKSMLNKAEHEMNHLKKIVDERVEKAVEKVRPSYKEEFAKINRKIDKLTKEVERLQKK